MTSYRVMPDTPVQLVVFVARLLAAHRREIGTRCGTSGGSCGPTAGMRIRENRSATSARLTPPRSGCRSELTGGSWMRHG